MYLEEYKSLVFDGKGLSTTNLSLKIIEYYSEYASSQIKKRLRSTKIPNLNGYHIVGFFDGPTQ